MAGGLGTRLAPFTTVLPKPLIPINGKPVIEHIIERFFENGFRKFYITLNYKSKILKAFFNEFKKYKKVKFIEEKKPLGTAGSLSFFKKKNYNNIIVINCDSLINLNYANYLKYHIESNNDMTLVGCKMSYAFPYGICKFKENNTLLSEIEEKKKYNFFVNTGLYILKSKLVSFKKNTKIDMNEFISILISKGKNIGIYPIDENSWKDVGQWNDYNKIKDKSNLN